MASDESIGEGVSVGKKAVRRPRRRKAAAARKRSRKDLFTPTNVIGALIVVAVMFLAYTMWKAPEAPSQGNLQGNLNQPDASKVNVVVLNDNRCGKDCDVSRLMTQLTSLFPGIDVKPLDIGMPEGKQVLEDSKIPFLPAILFDSTVESNKGYPAVSKYLEKAGKYWSLTIGANWDPYCDPSPEHCSEDKCKDRVSCRQEVPGKLDLYVMSQCPYGVVAMNSMKEVLSAFKEDLDFKISYLTTYDEKTGKIASLHGQPELDEDMREFCAMEEYGKDYKYMDYIWCRNQDVKSADWQKCATDNGMDAAKIKACAEGEEAKSVIIEQAKTGKQLGIFASPTFMVNNKKLFNAVSPAQIQEGICKSNPGFKGCKMNLTKDVGLPQAGSCNG